MNNLLRKLDLTSLRLFVVVCQEKNIARARGIKRDGVTLWFAYGRQLEPDFDEQC